MKVYGHPMSTCTRKVLTVLAEKGHEAQFVMVDLMKGEHKQPQYTALHPFGVIPLLDDDGFMLYESRAIIRYLDEKLSGPSLQPSDLKARARMNQWVSLEQSYLNGPTVKILVQRFMNPAAGRPSDETIVEAAKKDLTTLLDTADKHLADNEFLAGSTFSLAEACWLPYMQYLFATNCGELITSRPHLAAWWKRVSARPSWAKVAG